MDEVRSGQGCSTERVKVSAFGCADKQQSLQLSPECFGNHNIPQNKGAIMAIAPLSNWEG